MRVNFLDALLSVVSLALVPAGMALAHGQPVIAVDPPVVAAGGAITVTGTEVEPGEVFAITLEGVSGSLPLGEATVTGEGEEGEFTVTLTMPPNTAAGAYLVRAATAEGESATADLTVTAAGNASAGPAMVMDKASGELHVLDRTRSMAETVIVALAIVICGGLGVWLVRKRVDIPAEVPFEMAVGGDQETGR